MCVCKQPLMMAYETPESSQYNFGKFIHQSFTRKLERILIKLNRQNVFYYLIKHA